MLTKIRNTETCRLALDVFIISNFIFLGLDVALAHAIDAYVLVELAPCIFSALATVALLIWRERRLARLLVAGGAIAVGIIGMVLHLEGSYFVDLTTRSLVYAAPFVAPLAFTGVGCLLLLTCYVDSDDVAWGQWVLFLAACGWAGNFILSVLDHAQNGFFVVLEWIPVFSCALLLGALLVAMLQPYRQHWYCVVLLVLNAAIGVLGFVLHLLANIARGEMWLHGTPLFAPLLLPNLAVLAAIGLWGYRLTASARRH
ncbi:MAG: hypothetical protein OYH77_02190 [Pseudomonadota bacterium]|nr:hypothetical protein [Pseudomonadota bacterium]